MNSLQNSIIIYLQILFSFFDFYEEKTNTFLMLKQVFKLKMKIIIVISYPLTVNKT